MISILINKRKDKERKMSTYIRYEIHWFVANHSFLLNKCGEQHCYCNRLVPPLASSNRKHISLTRNGWKVFLMFSSLQRTTKYPFFNVQIVLETWKFTNQKVKQHPHNVCAIAKIQKTHNGQFRKFSDIMHQM